MRGGKIFQSCRNTPLIPAITGKFATADEAAHAMQICNEVRRAIREHLELSLDVSDD